VKLPNENNIKNGAKFIIKLINKINLIDFKKYEKRFLLRIHKNFYLKKRSYSLNKYFFIYLIK
jgi:hypothetical protein